MATMAQARIYLDERIQEIMGDLPEQLRNSKGYAVAKLYYKVKEYDTAIGFLQGFLREKDDAMAHKLIADCYRRRKPSDVPRALKHYKRSIEMDPHQPAVNLTLRKLLPSLGMVNSNYWLDLTTATMRKHLPILEEKINKIHQLQELQAEGIKALSEDMRFLHTQITSISNRQRQTQLFGDVQLAKETNPFINDRQSDLQALSPLGTSVVDPRDTTFPLLGVEQELVNGLQVKDDPLCSVQAIVPRDTSSQPLKPQAYTAQEEDIKFCYMGTLYRVVDQEWIDRCFGLIKIVRHSTTGVSRLLMRCSKTDKLTANHQIGADTIFSPNKLDKEKQSFLWTAIDDADEQSTMSYFLVQFQDCVTAETFRLAFAKAIEEAKVQQADTFPLPCWDQTRTGSSSASLNKPSQEQPTHPVRDTLPESVATAGVESMIKLFGGRVDLFHRNVDTNVWKWRGSGELNMLELSGHPGIFRFALREEESDKLLLLMSVTCSTDINYKPPKTLACTGLGMDNVITKGVMESVLWRFHSEEAALEFLSKVKNRLQSGRDQNA